MANMPNQKYLVSRSPQKYMQKSSYEISSAKLACCLDIVLFVVLLDSESLFVNISNLNTGNYFSHSCGPVFSPPPPSINCIRAPATQCKVLAFVGVQHEDIALSHCTNGSLEPPWNWLFSVCDQKRQGEKELKFLHLLFLHLPAAPVSYYCLYSKSHIAYMPTCKFYNRSQQ